MCFVIALLATVFAYNFYENQNIGMAMGSGLTALIFAVLMIRNIYYAKTKRKGGR
ncbi:MAG: hypothetical protein IE916_01820 [Epsilonproteobacteria bacterium]|nr:hypothetical protein [Campylobacterota bacterium]